MIIIIIRLAMFSGVTSNLTVMRLRSVLRYGGAARERKECSLLSRQSVCRCHLSLVSSPLSIIRLFMGRQRAAPGHCGDLLSFLRRAGLTRADCAWPGRVTLDRTKNSDQSQHTALPLFHHHHYHHDQQQQQQPSRGGDGCVGCSV